VAGTRKAWHKEPIRSCARHSHMTTRSRAALATPLLMVMLALVGCAGPVGGESSGGNETASEPASRSADASGGSTSTSGDAATGVKQSMATTPLNREVISTGQISVSTESISEARAQVIRLVTSYGGSVADEQTDSDQGGRPYDSSLTLRVPSSDFAEAMDALVRIGEVEHQSRKSEDVTTQVLDNDARVRAAERSIRQIEMLLGRADELRDIIAIESDLTRRQADLDSLKSQQAWLEDQTSLSTINVQLSRPSKAPEDEARGFLAGLADGWDAMGTATVALLTVLGAVLPFAVLVVLFGVPVRMVLRRRVSAVSAPARSA
jgi:Domain of unknown function (DUF4349)